MSNAVKKKLYRIIFYQLILLLGLTLMIGLLKGIKSSFSTLAGGLTYWVPTVFFILRVSAHTGAKAAMRFMIAFLTGEVMKLVLCGVLFLLVIQYLHAQLLYALIGLLGAIMAFWLASITLTYQEGIKR